MEPLLFLAHRIPYPPNKGDKIRSFHLLRHLVDHFRVHLGTYIDDADDWRHVEALCDLCRGGSTRFVQLHPLVGRLRGLPALGRGEALTVPYYRDRALGRWIGATLEREPIRKVVIFSSAPAQFLIGPEHAHLRRLCDFVDVDSEKWRQYGAHRPGPMGWIYRREARRLLTYERRVAAACEASFFVSEAEAELFRRLAPEVAGRVDYWENGVDFAHHSPEHGFADPYPPGGAVVVFTGAMDYWANGDAVAWFAREVWPLVRDHLGEVRFAIVGSRPTPEVKALASLPGVLVTGAVADVRPYVAHARVVVAPLRIAQGVQNKVLEGMAMGKPVVTSAKGMAGIRSPGELGRWATDDPVHMAGLISRLLTPEGAAEGEVLGRLGREHVQRHYAWERNLQRFAAALDPTAAT
ncbi:MAG: TIGR03087 family PEP-CTERM/XrtA system glycosyltransferase [Magnetococcales bacterium]|nr:TIGR03087 family PEP-CTERM/XrtA system glycosyltransferase [Magnetococcales bacterium]MBF0156778.1 TIGR03087 family PEP-CTERM/XrtA system glycosyltransferase [Magnetococcales bacterium]